MRAAGASRPVALAAANQDAIASCASFACLFLIVTERGAAGKIRGFGDIALVFLTPEYFQRIVIRRLPLHWT